MHRVFLFLLLSTSPAWAGGDGCHDLWFTRNLIMDRAGYCFGSALGQAAFDNSDCIGKSVSLDPASAQMVDQIRGMERFHGCTVDTGQVWLDLDDVFIRRQLTDLPIREEFESACIGWLGPVTILYSGHSPGAVPVGQIQPGDTLSYSHLPVGNWTYLTVRGPDWQIKGGGWLDTAATPEQCREVAG
ncbi:MAG: DUF4453 domain-containing protein [Ruegeria sp.]|uniref:DUF4453 domain-containing protein n=1 Tax=Ruegeria sp. TaxID=1879320 RepID=UPI00349E9258